MWDKDNNENGFWPRVVPYYPNFGMLKKPYLLQKRDRKVHS